MKTPKPKLFTKEFIDLVMLVLSLSVGAVVIIVYKNTMPIWAIVALGFWYPVWVFASAVWNSNKGNDL